MCPIWIRYLRFFCLAVLALASSAAADYAIDNANSSVLYSVAPDGSGASWATYGVGLSSIILETGNTNITVDASKCYDENFALASCVTNDACQIEFPFTGSGVTIYILNAGFQGVSASLTVDNGQAVTTTIPPPNPPSYQTPNVSLFSIQSLSYDNHNAKVSLLDWNNQGTALYFDYALINESYVEPVVPPSSAPATTSHPTSTTAPTTSSTSSTPTPSSSSLAMNSTTVSSSSSSTTTRSTSATPTTSSTISGSTFANAPSVTPVSSPTTPNNDRFRQPWPCHRQRMWRRRSHRTPPRPRLLPQKTQTHIQKNRRRQPHSHSLPISSGTAAAAVCICDSIPFTLALYER
ncbi:hypothetical protein F5I97DRAFT_627757 [Phlebopus sp. FC_14]|nr:hypothetical protein F5I97DRAFT_627757 [Phlebopus sp. FC_14]